MLVSLYPNFVDLNLLKLGTYQASLAKEKTLCNQLDEAQAVIMALQDELRQALHIFNMSNPCGPYEIILTQTDPNYIRALGRNYWP
jgi:hypothetical protein